jgi:NAD(P)-dependent dehydrogenase (short-subunit alcohol dehydrogenase family)
MLAMQKLRTLSVRGRHTGYGSKAGRIAQQRGMALAMQLDAMAPAARHPAAQEATPTRLMESTTSDSQRESATSDSHAAALQSKHVKRDMQGKVVVVTGASAGVGRATVRAFAARGAKVGLIARGRDGLQAAQREVESYGSEALLLPLDVADATAVDQAAEQVEQTLGPIDVWVNDAMVSVFAPIMNTTPEEFRRVTEVTYLGFVHGTLAALKRMKPRDRGVIVQVGSALAYRSIPLQAAYCAAKHAVHGFTESLRTELIHDRSNVHVTAVHLPAVNTPQFSWSRAKLPRQPQPVPPIFQPEVAADAIVFAAQHRRREIWLGWPVVKAILGEDIVPGYADKYLAENGYDSQQTDQPIESDRRDNLYAPVPGDHGAHGTFDSLARSFSIEFWLSKHRTSLLLCAGLAMGGAALRYAYSRS